MPCFARFALATLLLAAAPVAHAGDAPPAHVIDGAGTTTTYACGQREQVIVKGSRHNLTLSGECGQVKVSGSDNVVAIEATQKISVMGTGNKVTYQRGVDGKPPKIARGGRGNTIGKTPAG